MIDKRPLLIARCTDAADVIAAANVGRTHMGSRLHSQFVYVIMACGPAGELIAMHIRLMHDHTFFG